MGKQKSGPKAKDENTTGKESSPLLVGIGASAGGIDAISEMLESVADDGCCTMFIVQHQSPDADRDMLSNLLKKHTKHQVSVAEDGEVYLPGRIYVCPPAMVLSLFNGKIQLDKRDDTGNSMIIDSFFRSMGRESDGHCVAVILTGSNTDGTLGARTVKEKNGLVIAQNPETAAFPTMPQSIIDEDLADLVLEPADIAQHIEEFAERISLIPPEAMPERHAVPESERDKLLMLLKNRSRHDFSKYKENTVNRRIQRRMSIHRLDRLQDYLSYVRENKEEADRLFKDLLIGVTSFFRDPKAFVSLKELLIKEYLPKLERKNFRAWVPGCSTGEEAYSVAVILHEALNALDSSLDVNVYATDLDEDSIKTARKGIFPANIRDDVPEKRLKRFFNEENGKYRIKNTIRESVIFAVQNVIYDPPFSKLDLICCRNLLMYLKPDAQNRVLKQFRYGLTDGGLLMLGSSESVSALDKPFTAKAKEHRIYELKTEEAKAGLPEEQAIPEYRPIPSGRLQRKKTESSGAGTDLRPAAERFLLQEAGPAVFVNKAGDVLYFHGRSGRYLEPASGAPSSNVIAMAREGLSYELSAALSAAAAKDEVQIRTGVKVRINDHEDIIDLRVTPAHLEEYDGPCFMITFTLVPEQSRAAVRIKEHSYSEENIAYIRELEEEIQHCREDMQAIIQEYEAANEELQSSNEELQSSNEELKSTNEELETAKEELQSINEEEATLNQELQAKNSQLAGINDDMKNLLTGTQVATLFLDSELHIRRFTPAMQEIIRLRDSDLGRPIAEMNMNIKYNELEADAEKVLSNLNTLRRELRDKDGKWYQLRITPYRTTDNVIGGVVCTFINITELKKNERVTQAALRFSESIVDTVNEPLIILDQTLQVSRVNMAFLEQFNTSREETVGKKLYRLGNKQWDIPELRKVLEEVLPQKNEIKNFVVEHDFPNIGAKRMYLNARAVPMEADEKQRILLAVTAVEDL